MDIFIALDSFLLHNIRMVTAGLMIQAVAYTFIFYKFLVSRDGEYRIRLLWFFGTATLWSWLMVIFPPPVFSSFRIFGYMLPHMAATVWLAWYIVLYYGIHGVQNNEKTRHHLVYDRLKDLVYTDLEIRPDSVALFEFTSPTPPKTGKPVDFVGLTLTHDFRATDAVTSPFQLYQELPIQMFAFWLQGVVSQEILELHDLTTIASCDRTLHTCLTDWKVKGMVGVGIYRDRKPIGLLLLYYGNHREPLTSDEKRLLREACRDVEPLLK